jgi:hypothetical protein
MSSQNSIRNHGKLLEAEKNRPLITRWFVFHFGDWNPVDINAAIQEIRSPFACGLSLIRTQG